MLKLRNSHVLYAMIAMIFLCACVPQTVVVLKKNPKPITGDDVSLPAGHTLLAALTSPFASISSGFCFLKNSQNFCWGDALPMAENVSTSITALSPLYGKTIEKYSTSYSTSCVIASGEAYCWGLGAIGNSPERFSDIPVAVSTAGVLSGKTLKDIYTTSFLACAIDTGNDIYCWGNGVFGGLGNGASVDSAVPVAVSKAGVLNGLTIKSVAMGSNHVCVIASDDKVYCWGSGSSSQLGNGASFSRNIPVAAVIPGGLTVKELKAANYTTCAIASNDQVYCWGIGTNGQIGNGANLEVNSPTAVDTTGVLNGKTIKSLTFNYQSVCAIANDDQAYCWGHLGKLVNGTDNYVNVPTAVDQSGVLNGLTIKKIVIGTGTFCAIASDDKVYCWGDGTDGRLGNGSTAHSPVPVAVSTSGVLSGKVIVEVIVNTTSSCARDSANEIYCWGKNSTGQLGNNSKTDSSVPVSVSKLGEAVGKTFTSLGPANNTNLNCAIGSDIQLYCWGYNIGSGLPTPNGQLYPLPIYSNSVSNTALSNITFQTSSPGGSFCMQLANGDYYCQGESFIKRFNFGIQFKEAKYFSTSEGVCYLGVNNLAYCTGEILGNTSTVFSNVPLAVDMTNVGVGVTIKDLQVGYYHACFLASNDKVYCWGKNYSGILGNGTIIDSVIPIEIDMSGVLSGKTIKALTVGALTTCVIANDNQGYCWGYNPTGTVGNGTIVDALSPVAIDTSGVLNGKLLRNISAGLNSTCAIADDNLAYCWGQNTTGALGNGTLIDSSSPVLVDTTGVLNGKTMKGLLLADYFTCSIASDNQVYCWGLNDKGQLGNGTNTDSSVPTAVSTAGVLNNKTVKNLKLSVDTSCVVASDDKAYCWGDGSFNNLGDNNGTASNLPVEVLYAP